jgi:hypothetical protein
MKTHDNTAVPQWAKDAARSYWTYEGTHTPEFLAQIIARHAPAQVAELERELITMTEAAKQAVMERDYYQARAKELETLLVNTIKTPPSFPC